jgi:hypothetical protein
MHNQNSNHSFHYFNQIISTFLSHVHNPQGPYLSHPYRLIHSFIHSYFCCSFWSTVYPWNASFHFSFLILQTASNFPWTSDQPVTRPLWRQLIPTGLWRQFIPLSLYARSPLPSPFPPFPARTDLTTVLSGRLCLGSPATKRTGCFCFRPPLEARFWLIIRNSV